jgi:hypothetical protein
MSARIQATNSPKAASLTGRLPMLMSALSPVPTPANIRPGASSAMVTKALAVTLGWRVNAFVTRGPILMLLVALRPAVQVT